MDKLDVLKITEARWAFPVGSRVTCNPPPVDTDEDWLCLVWNDPSNRMQAEGFKQDGSPQFYTGNDNGGFRSWRRDEVNIVTTQDEAFARKFMAATELARRFNLLKKADRIALFQAVLYGVGAENLQAETFEAIECPPTPKEGESEG